MILDAASGAMPETSLDLDGDGAFTAEEMISGIRGLNNPLASPTIVATQLEDVVLTNDDQAAGSSSTGLDAVTNNGRMSWRELEP